VMDEASLLHCSEELEMAVGSCSAQEELS
jgi:hypothetical protein